jgi:hypothetical protein
MLTLPWYWKSVSETDPAESTDAAAGAVTAAGAAACFCGIFFALALADLPLADGEAVADVDGVADGVAVPD